MNLNPVSSLRQPRLSMDRKRPQQPGSIDAGIFGENLRPKTPEVVNFNQTFISPSLMNSKIGTFLSTFKSDIQIGLFERLMLIVSCSLTPFEKAASIMLGLVSGVGLVPGLELISIRNTIHVMPSM